MGVPPSLNAEGQPLDYHDDTLTHLGQQRLDMYENAVEEIAGRDPYAALLILDHLDGLLNADHGRSSVLRDLSAEQIVEPWLRRREARRRELCKGIEAHEHLRQFATPEHQGRNGRVIEVCDQLAQLMCNRFPLNSAARGNDPNRRLRELHVTESVGSEELTLRIEMTDEAQAVLDPYPFDQSPLPVTFLARLISSDVYRESADFRSTSIGPSRFPCATPWREGRCSLALSRHTGAYLIAAIGRSVRARTSPSPRGWPRSRPCSLRCCVGASRLWSCPVALPTCSGVEGVPSSLEAFSSSRCHRPRSDCAGDRRRQPTDPIRPGRGGQCDAAPLDRPPRSAPLRRSPLDAPTSGNDDRDARCRARPRADASGVVQHPRMEWRSRGGERLGRSRWICALLGESPSRSQRAWRDGAARGARAAGCLGAVAGRSRRCGEARMPPVSGSVVAGVIYVGVVPSAVAVACWAEGVRRIGSTAAAVLFCLLPRSAP